MGERWASTKEMGVRREQNQKETQKKKEQGYIQSSNRLAEQPVGQSASWLALKKQGVVLFHKVIYNVASRHLVSLARKLSGLGVGGGCGCFSS
jgi:hypothetical protein